MADYKWNIGISQSGIPGSDYKWNIGVTHKGDAVITYVDLSATGGGAGGGSASLLLMHPVDMSATGGGTGGGDAALLTGSFSFSPRAQVRRLTAAGNDQFWYEDAMAAGMMVELVAARGDIDTSDQLVLFELCQKIFVVNGTKLKVVDFSNTKITTANIGSHYPDRGNILTSSGGAQMVVDYITAKTGAVTIYGTRTTAATFASGHTVTGTDDDDNAISFTLNASETAPPHWYNWKPYANDTAAFGTLPEKAYLGCAYRGRAVLSGNPDYPNQYYMSREGNPFDFNFFATDALHAVAGGIGDLGKLGDMPRALIPYRDDALMFGCSGSVTILRGNPADGGYMDQISSRIGVFGQDAWCFDADGNLYFWGTGGIYTSPRGFGPLQNITEERYPNLIRETGANPATHRVMLGHDPSESGVQIAITRLADGDNDGYWLDLRTKALFTDGFHPNHGAYSMFFYDANDTGDKRLIIGCTDGHMRFFDASKKSDDGEAIDSYVDYGPIQLADRPDHEGVVYSVEAELGGESGGTEVDSDDLTWRIWVDQAADAVNKKLDTNAAPNIGGTFAAPGRRMGGAVKRKIKGVYAGIKLRNNALDESWSFEKMLVGVRPVGRAK